MTRTALVALTMLAVGALGLPGPARAQTCFANVPHVTGTWVTVPYLMPINPISATLLHTGKILIVAGSENDPDNYSAGGESYRNAVWDPTGTDESSITVQNVPYDVFCSGTAVLPDGRPLVIGGTASYAFTGDNRASIFNPTTEDFVQSQNMADGRWYGTATALGDGRIMAFSGYNSGGGINNTVEIYSLTDAGAGWTTPVTAPFSPSLFPRLLLLPDGTVFFTGQGTGNQTANSWRFNPANQQWTSSAATTGVRQYGSAVLLPLLPPSYRPQVVNFGGSGQSSTEIIDLSASSPTWTPGPNMSTGRIEMNAVILPNGKVLTEGGSVTNEVPDTPGKTADLYDPVSNSFSSGGTASCSRLYHSTALLLPDATVMSMGSNPDGGNYEPAIEIYTPPYLFDANDQLITNRPAITGTSLASGVVGYNAPFSVTYTSASPISSAVLVRPGADTHGFDMDQRLIGLCGPSPQPACSGSGTLTLTSPPNGNIAPPGYYMLFLLDSAGVPSKAQFIQLSPYTTTPPSGTITSPASDVTIPAGGSVAFGTTTAAAQYSWVFSSGSPGTSTAQNPGTVEFDTPGTYVASLTVIDGTGNSDPDPPTRTITVTPPTPDFSIAVSPSANEVVPGQSTTFTVTVTPISGFTGTVSLSAESYTGFPTGITSGGFNPASISGAGSATLTMNTTASATPYALSITVTGTSGSISHTADTTLLVNIPPPLGLTATAGNAQVSLSWPASLGASSYTVQRALVSGGPYVTVGCPTTTSYTDTGLTNGTTYYYVVAGAYTGDPNAGGGSAASPEASATPQNVPLASITVTPANQSLTVGGTQQFTATGKYSDGSTQNLTSQVTWASSNTAAATINATGLATAAARRDHDDLGDARGGERQHGTHGHGGAAHDHDHGAARGDGGSGLQRHPRGHRRNAALHLVTRERHAACGTGPPHGRRRDLGNANSDRDFELHRQGHRRGAECHQGPQHHGELRDRDDLADQPDAGHRRRRRSEPGDAGREVPVRCGGRHHGPPLLQGRYQHRLARRNPVVEHGPEPRDGGLHGRDELGLAAGELREPRGHPGQHGLRRVLLRAQRPLQRQPQLLRDAGHGHAAAACARDRRRRRQRRVRLRRGGHVP